MTAARLTPSEVILRAAAVGASLTGVVVSACGIAMFWGPLRQVLTAPAFVALGVIAYIIGRALWATTTRPRV